MRDTLRIGFIPLADCAPLVVAQEQGFFARHGLKVELCKAQSWDQILDRLVSGQLDAAHLLLTLPLQWALTAAGRVSPVVYAVALSQHGNAITLSNALWRAGVRDAATLKAHLAARGSGRPLKLAVVHPRSTHEYLLRLWLERGGLQPGRDVQFAYGAPPAMVHQLRSGDIDGYCVGEPWNQRAVTSKLGYIVATSCDVLPPMNEKVLAVRAGWHRRHPETHAALIRAVLAAADWLAAPQHLERAADLTAGKHYVNTPRAALRAAFFGVLEAGGGRLLRPEGFLRFGGPGANYPDLNHARFYLEQMWRAGHILPEEAQALDLESICLHEFYRQRLDDAGSAESAQIPETSEIPYGDFLAGFPRPRDGNGDRALTATASV